MNRFAMHILVHVFGGDMHLFILDINLGVNGLGHGSGICSALVDNAKEFFKVITPRMGAQAC